MREAAPEEAVCPHCGHVAGTPEKESFYLREGTLLAARYLVGSALGSGAFGITYAAYDLMLERRVAIKEYLPGELCTRLPGQETVSVFDGEKAEMFQKGLEKFSDEAQRLLSCSGIPGIVRLYDTVQANNTAYIIMEYLDGKPLKQVLAENGGKIGFEETLGYMLPILSALEEVHKLGLVHRDISPDNIMITEEGEAKLIDFGAARYANTETSKSLSVMLKPGYAPEEQYRSRGKQGPWSDVYALGATFYKCITGVAPVASIERMANDTLKPPSKLGAKLPASAETAILNALNKETEYRTENTRVFAEELCAEKVERRGEPVKRNPLSLNKPLKIAIGSVAALLVAVIVLALTGVINIGALSVAGRSADIVLVPDMVRMTVSEAENLLNTEQADKGLLLVVSERQISDVVPADMIMMQIPQGGNRTLRGAALSVVISDGAEVKVELGIVPNVQYRTEEEAIRLLEKAGYTAETVYVESDTVKAGLVISQSADAGETHPAGEKIVLVISLGSEAQTQAENIANDYKEDTNKAPLIGHSQHEYTDWTTTRKPTCEENGISTGICSCGQTETREIPATGHNYKNAVCTECGKRDPSHSHSYSWTVRTRPGCTSDGEEEGVCICGDRVTRTIPAEGHNYGANDKCTACGMLSPNHTHSGEYVRDQEPTCTNIGRDKWVCPVCGNTEYRDVPARGHSYVWKVTTGATCTSNGVETEICSVCGATGGTRTVEKSGHTYSKGYCTRCGAANPNAISIPNVDGMSEASATSALKDCGFKVSVSQAYNWQVSSGTVFAQSATGSGHVGDTITITVSKGTKPIAAGDTVYVSAGYWYYDSFGGTPRYWHEAGTFTVSQVITASGRPYPISLKGKGWVSYADVSQRTN